MPMSLSVTYAYTARGEVAAVTLPGNRTRTFEYNGAGDLSRSINPTGNQMRFQTDGAGRLITLTDPLGFDTRTEFNGADQITKVINPLQESRITYDEAQRPASIIDARGIAIESHQYDQGDRLIARTDALNRVAGAVVYCASDRSASAASMMRMPW